MCCLLQSNVDAQPHIYPKVAITALRSCACEQDLASLHACAALRLFALFWHTSYDSRPHADGYCSLHHEHHICPNSCFYMHGLQDNAGLGSDCSSVQVECAMQSNVDSIAYIYTIAYKYTIAHIHPQVTASANSPILTAPAASSTRVQCFIGCTILCFGPSNGLMHLLVHTQQALSLLRSARDRMTLQLFSQMQRCMMCVCNAARHQLRRRVQPLHPPLSLLPLLLRLHRPPPYPPLRPRPLHRLPRYTVL